MTQWRHWRYLGALAWLILITLFIAALYTDITPKKVLLEDKTIEIKNSVIAGYRYGKVSWKVYCDYIWAGKNKTLFYAKKVNSGLVNDASGERVMDSIHSEDIRINTQYPSFDARAHVSARFYQRGSQRSMIQVFADRFLYFQETSFGLLEGHVSLKRGPYTLFSHDKVTLDSERNTATFEKGFHLISPHYDVTGDRMVIDIDTRISELNGKIHISRKGDTIPLNSSLDIREKTLRQLPSSITCDFIRETDIEGNHSLELHGHILAWQTDKRIAGDDGFYSEKEGLFQIERHVQFHAKTLGWVLDPIRKKNLKNKDILKALGEPVSFTCETCMFDSKKRSLLLSGKVVIIQPDLVVTCERFYYDDTLEMVSLTGHVSLQKGIRNRFECEALYLDLKKESFTSKEGIRSLFYLKKNTHE